MNDSKLLKSAPFFVGCEQQIRFKNIVFIIERLAADNTCKGRKNIGEVVIAGIHNISYPFIICS